MNTKRSLLPETSNIPVIIALEINTEDFLELSLTGFALRTLSP